MPSLKRSLTLVQRPGGGDQYVVKSVKNTTAYNIGQTVRRKDVDQIISADGVEVNIVGK